MFILRPIPYWNTNKKSKKNMTMRTGLGCIFTLLIFTLPVSCQRPQSTEEYLKEVQQELEKIESATYYTHNECWQPGDTTTTVVDSRRYIKEYNNPSDTTIGASYVSLSGEDTTHFEFGYDGKIRTLINHETKNITVDNFTYRPMPFRPLTPPFFNYAKSIVNYMLTTKDSIEVERKQLDWSTHIRLTIHEKHVIEFFGKPYPSPNTAYNDLWGTTSIYELWIDDSNHLPYKVRREMPHETTATTCYDAELNQLNIAHFNIYDYFPADYNVRDYGSKPNQHTSSNLIGQKAPDWILKDMNEQTVTLSDLKSKVVLINLTGIGCGPCLSAIPFLKELRNKYNTTDFELIAIETWTRKPHSLQVYSKKHEMNYPMLSGTDEVIKDYQTGGAAPVFFVLDEKRVIRKVMTGYSKDTTDGEVSEAIAELLK